MTTIIKDGKTIRTSKNLRGMLDYARVSPVTSVNAYRDPSNSERGLLDVTYFDGAQSRASFASYHVMVDWVRERRSWRNRGARVAFEENMGYLTKPGIVASS